MTAQNFMNVVRFKLKTFFQSFFGIKKEIIAPYCRSTLLFLDKVPIFCYSFKSYYFEQITGLKNDETCNHFLTNCLSTYLGSIHWVKNK